MTRPGQAACSNLNCSVVLISSIRLPLTFNRTSYSSPVFLYAFTNICPASLTPPATRYLVYYKASLAGRLGWLETFVPDAKLSSSQMVAGDSRRPPVIMNLTIVSGLQYN